MIASNERHDLLEIIENDNIREKIKRKIAPHSRLEVQREIGKGIPLNRWKVKTLFKVAVLGKQFRDRGWG